MRLLAAPLARRLLPVIEREKPDVVVCAYPFSCQLAAILKARGLLRAKVVHMLTDYGAHAAWISGEADEYWASCEEAAQELVRRGVPKEKIVVRSVLRVFRMLDALPDDFEAVVITGKNEKLFRRFEALAAASRHRLHPILFTDRVPDYMHACDLLVTKPGGLTSSEALAAGIPMALFDPIPGQEEDNARYLTGRGSAVLLSRGWI